MPLEEQIYETLESMKYVSSEEAQETIYKFIAIAKDLEKKKYYITKFNTFICNLTEVRNQKLYMNDSSCKYKAGCKFAD